MASESEPPPKPNEEPPEGTLPPHQAEAVNAAVQIGSQTWEIDDAEGLLNPLAFPTVVPELTESNPVAKSVPASSESNPVAPPPSENSSPSTPQATSIPAPPPALALAVVEESVPPTPLQIIEALLFVGGPPLTYPHVRDAIRELTEFEFLQIIDRLDETYRQQARPYEIASTLRGYTLRLRSRFEPVRQRMFGGPREIRLSQPALDVLSIIAYRQPITVADIDTLRGIDSMGLIRQLVRLGLVMNTGKGDQGPTYVTTERFLEMFGLKDLEDLPKLGATKKIT
jgi:segregation and condensation protein B